jgi:hypothetical protein
MVRVPEGVRPGPGEALVSELWGVDAPVPSVDQAAAARPVAGWQIDCPPGATRWRLVEFGPLLLAPLHRTDTLDYSVVLEGMVDLLLDDGREVRLTAGDGVVIPGLVHGWRTGEAGCRKLLVMTGLARPGPEQPGNTDAGQTPAQAALLAASAYIQAINEGRYEDLGDLFSPDAQWFGYGREPQRGRPAIAAYYQEFLSRIKPTIRAGTMVADGSRCVVELEHLDQSTGRFIRGPVDHFTVDSTGQICRFVVYAAPEQFD